MKYGFIGCGNMGGAIAKALALATTDFALSDRSGKGKALAAQLGATYSDNASIAKNCDRIFLAVKPYFMKDMLAQLQDILAERKPLLITMAGGVEIQQISTDSLRSKIAKVSQDTFLFPGTIRENLLLANPKADDAELKAMMKKVCLTKFMEQLPKGLDTDIGENGLLLSGGERQKLGLAMGLLRGCKIILLDEVTANIDRDSEEEIKNVLLQLKKEQDLTLISISHRIDFLKDADRIVVLENGRIKEETTYQKYKTR
mgnify:CR=1 FL=1